MVAVLLGFCKVPLEWWNSFATFFFLACRSARIFFLFHLCCMQFFSSDKGLQEIFFRNHPPPPPPSRVKWSAPNRFHGLSSVMPNTITEKFLRLYTMTVVNAYFFRVHELRCIELAPNIRQLHELWAPLDIRTEIPHVFKKLFFAWVELDLPWCERLRRLRLSFFFFLEAIVLLCVVV